MKFIPTRLKGSFIIELNPIYDDRGGFARTFCKKEFLEIGHTKEFVQFNQSFNTKKGTVRGMHYQLHPYSEIKLIRCVSGAVLDVIVDLRKNSETYLQYISVELSESNLLSIYVPEGFAHGFQTLEDNTQLIYHHSEYYTPGADAGLNFKDPLLNIKWPLDVSSISEKDKTLKFIDGSFAGL